MIRSILILIITITLIGCDCSITGPQVFNVGTFSIKFEDHWFPNDSNETIVFVDSLGSELQYRRWYSHSLYEDWRFFAGNSSCEEYYGKIEKKRMIYENTESGYIIDYILIAGKENNKGELIDLESGQITIRDPNNLIIEVNKSDSLEVNSQFDLDGQLLNTHKWQFNGKVAHFSKGYGIIYFEDNKGQKWTLTEY